ncbi:FkbM family methyltransferase [Cypionkella sinensis]|uniref:FkbM family methyltransferase n=1 Tax=Cypionkella sinensis TaxID=1756043 RepID=A0ABV7IYV0_9RHOB
MAENVSAGVKSADYLVSTFSVEGMDFTFNVGNPNDAIQKVLLSGSLFDFPEILEMVKYIKDGDTIADVGSNVGNHAVYYSKKFPNARILPFEPNAEAMRLLVANLDSNGGCPNVDRRYIGFGMSDQSGAAVSWRGGDNNLGNSKILDASNLHLVDRDPARFNETRLVTGDDVFLESGVDFIKIDVEGHEVPCLMGLKKTLDRHHPVVFIEISNDNMKLVTDYFADLGYVDVWKDTHYAKVTNKIFVFSAEKRPA